MRDLVALPKAHLHLHLEGAMRPSTLTELAHRYGVPLPSMTGYGSFAVFIDTYTAACQVLRSEEDLRRLVREVVEDAVLAGAMWVEPSLGPANADFHAANWTPVEGVLESERAGCHSGRVWGRLLGGGRVRGCGAAGAR